MRDNKREMSVALRVWEEVGVGEGLGRRLLWRVEREEELAARKARKETLLHYVRIILHRNAMKVGWHSCHQNTGKRAFWNDPDEKKIHYKNKNNKPKNS
jgi:hypothetical protein